MIYPSPLETLASYAIAFAAGALFMMLVAAYGKWIKAQADSEELPIG